MLLQVMLPLLGAEAEAGLKSEHDSSFSAVCITAEQALRGSPKEMEKGTNN